MVFIMIQVCFRVDNNLQKRDNVFAGHFHMDQLTAKSISIFSRGFPGSCVVDQQGPSTKLSDKKNTTKSVGSHLFARRPLIVRQAVQFLGAKLLKTSPPPMRAPVWKHFDKDSRLPPPPGGWTNHWAKKRAAGWTSWDSTEVRQPTTT